MIKTLKKTATAWKRKQHHRQRLSRNRPALAEADRAEDFSHEHDTDQEMGSTDQKDQAHDQEHDQEHELSYELELELD